MCGQLRMHAWTQLGAAGRTGDFQFLVSPEVVRDDYVLSHTACVVINRVMGPESSEYVKYYGRLKKKHGFRIVVDYDDVIWDVDGRSLLPDYNGCTFDPKAVGTWIDNCIEYIDEVTISTRFLASLWVRRFGSRVPVSIVPNYLPRAWYGHRKRHVDADVVKPRVVYGGSPTHYRDDNLGDFSGTWVPWMIDAVHNDRIELHMFGYGLKAPFLAEIKDKVVMHDPTSAWEWGSTLRDIGADIYMAPLADNDFNCAKSNLKLLEACACGMALLGSSFIDGPYEMAHPLSLVSNEWSVDQMQARVDKICEKDNFNAILSHQDKLMSHFWLEDDRHIGAILKTWCRGYLNG